MVSISSLSNSRTIAQPYRCRVSGATGANDCTLTRLAWNGNSHSHCKIRIPYLTQVEVPVTTADFYFSIEPRPLLVFVDGWVHVRTAKMIKDEELRTLLRKRGYKVPELRYNNYSNQMRDSFFAEILENLVRL